MFYMSYSTKTITCQDCKQAFAYTADEQEFYRQKGWEDPVRCPICRGIYDAAQKDKFRGRVKRGNTS